MDLFNLPSNGSFINYEIASNYFDDTKVPKRIKALIKNPKLVGFLINPIERAFLFYEVWH